MNLQRLNALLTTESPFGLTPKLTQPQPAPDSPDFGEVLAKAISAVETDQVAVQDSVKKLATGEIKDISEVMIASERANLSLGLALQVRNKMLEAYQEIMRMPL